MKQAVMTAPGEIAYYDIEAPTPNDDEVLMKACRIGVCGSDIHVYHGKHPYTTSAVAAARPVNASSCWALARLAIWRRRSRANRARRRS